LRTSEWKRAATVRFEADRRLIEILVGSSLYPNPDVCVRELVQNAWDAIQQRKSVGDGGGGQVVVRFSPQSRLFEVEDDGIGMDEHDLEESFLRVGRDKFDALKLEGEAPEQVALFGIGVLSVFLVADSLTVVSRKAGSGSALRIEFEGIQDNVAVQHSDWGGTGTVVTVKIREGAPFTAEQVPQSIDHYVRHVPGVVVRNIDTGEDRQAGDAWEIGNLLDLADAPTGTIIRAGKLGFSPVLRSPVGSDIQPCHLVQRRVPSGGSRPESSTTAGHSRIWW
jgi:molecular chaperone HtpG